MHSSEESKMGVVATEELHALEALGRVLHGACGSNRGDWAKGN